MQATQIDPRAPRLAAVITSILTLATFFVAQLNLAVAISILAVVTALFAWSLLSPQTHPYQKLFQAIRPKLGEPEFLEDSKPPRFAQKIGFALSALGLVFSLFFPLPAILIASAMVFAASFLNGFFGYCLGCEMYLGLRKLGINLG